MLLSTHAMPSAGGKPADMIRHESLFTASAVDSGRAVSSVSPPLEGLNSPSQSVHDSPSTRPLTTLPLRTMQSSRTAPGSIPFASASVPPATSSEVIQSSVSRQHLSSSSPVNVLNQLPLLPEHPGHSHMGKGFALGTGTIAEKWRPHLESGKVKTHKASDPQASSDLPGQPLPTEPHPRSIQKESKASDNIGDVQNVEQPSTRISTPLYCPSARHSSLTVGTSFDHSLITNSQYGGSSAYSTPSRIHTGSLLDKSSANSNSCIHDSSSFGNSFHLGNGTSHTEEQPSSVYETTRDGRSSVDYSSLNSTHVREFSEEGESMLESSLNSTSFGATHPSIQGIYMYFSNYKVGEKSCLCIHLEIMLMHSAWNIIQYIVIYFALLHCTCNSTLQNI